MTLSHPPRATSRGLSTSARSAGAPASRSQLLEAARLGAGVAVADLAGAPRDAAAHHASWRRLRRRSGRQSRQLLRVAFDTGYGRAMQGAGVTPG